MASEAYAAALELEKAVRTGQIERYGELSAILNKHLNVVLDSIRSLLDRVKSRPEEPAAPERAPDARALLSEIRDKLEQDLFLDTEAVRLLNSAIPEEKALIFELKDNIENFEYDLAKTVLEKLAGLVDKDGKGERA